jgi:hypothetical protein
MRRWIAPVKWKKSAVANLQMQGPQWSRFAARMLRLTVRSRHLDGQLLGIDVESGGDFLASGFVYVILRRFSPTPHQKVPAMAYFWQRGQ